MPRLTLTLVVLVLIASCDRPTEPMEVAVSRATVDPVTLTPVETHGTFEERWRLEGGPGPELRVYGRWNEHFVYGTPGDGGTRTQTITGNEVSAIAPGQGNIFQNTGITRFDPDGDVARQGGPHDFYTDFEGAIAAACKILDPAGP